MERNDTVGCHRLVDLERLAAFGAIAVWIVGSAGLPRCPLCCSAYLHQHSQGHGHSSKTVSTCSTQRVDNERQGVDAHLDDRPFVAKR